MTKLSFTKYEGAGNDFCVVDDRAGIFPREGESTPLVRALCDRRRGVGADGVLLLRAAKEPGFDFTMKYLNADGSVGEMCGNGARCLCHFAHSIGAAAAEMRFLTDSGPYRARVVGDDVRLDFPPVENRPRPVAPVADGRTWPGWYLRVGNPHVVVPVEDLDGLDVNRIGRLLRHHEAFAPAGVNINFVAEQPDGLIRVRTYERGVEEETLACGTGSVASAMCLSQGAEGYTERRMRPTGGVLLGTGFDPVAGGYANVWMQGPAKAVFQGFYPLP